MSKRGGAHAQGGRDRAFGGGPGGSGALVAVEERDGSTDIALSPAFDSTTTSYTASVANDVDQITIIAAENDDSATVEYLDGDYMEITDADTGTDDLQVDLDVGANTIKVKVTAEDDNTEQTYTVVVTRAEAIVTSATTVSSSWSLKPTAIGAGGIFRLLALTSNTRDATATGIATYNTHVQTDISANGHADIQSDSSFFQVLGCTESTSAITNTSTGSSDTDAPIYWLNGDKVADDYDDLYDGGWDSNAPKLTDGSAVTRFDIKPSTRACNVSCAAWTTIFRPPALQPPTPPQRPHGPPLP